MPGIEIRDVGQGDQLTERGRCLSRHRLQQMADMITGVDAGEYLADEPCRRIIEDRHVLRPDVPAAASELVTRVSGLAAEQPSQLRVLTAHYMHRQMIRIASDAVGVVALGQPDQKPRWLDAALTRKADEAARAATLDRGGDDEHGVIQLADQPLKSIRSRHDTASLHALKVNVRIPAFCERLTTRD